jgi:bifunctional non-homologous end joining protein LigD
VQFIEQQNPDDFVTTMSKKKRTDKIFLDYLRNSRGATAIAAYSTRAMPHAPIATPVHWNELTHDKRDTFFTLFTLPNRLQELKEDPWENFWTVKQTLKI